ncbi:hypothetical protein Golomagni_06315, partial [Golovinomyces magnicellulatus]
LNLPAPQIGEGELEDIGKMGRMGEAANTRARESENDATRGLVNSYSTLNSSTPIRTPKAPEQEDHIANEIRNIRALNETKSALLGGENTPLHEGAGSTGFDGITPRSHTTATPNPMATPMANSGVGATPARTGQTPMRTPRDTFALNQEDGMDMTSATPRDIKMRDALLRNTLRSGLGSLPKPKATEWEFELPEDQRESAQVEEISEEDAAERDRRARERQAAIDELERRRRTQVMQRNLPRPVVVDVSDLSKRADAMENAAERLIAQEVAFLMAHDAQKYPVPGGQVKGSFRPLLHIEDSDLADARLLIMSEAKSIPSTEEIRDLFDGRATDATLLGMGCYNGSSEEETAAAIRASFDNVQDSIMNHAEQGAKLEKKLGLHLGGYQKRQKMLRDKIGDAADALEKAKVALSGFKTLAISEDAAVDRRLDALRGEVAYVSRREREAQEEYRKAREELDSLVANGVNGH